MALGLQHFLQQMHWITWRMSGVVCWSEGASRLAAAAAGPPRRRVGCKGALFPDLLAGPVRMGIVACPAQRKSLMNSQSDHLGLLCYVCL